MVLIEYNCQTPIWNYLQQLLKYLKIISIEYMLQYFVIIKIIQRVNNLPYFDDDKILGMDELKLYSYVYVLYEH